MWESIKSVYALIIGKVIDVENLTRGKTGEEKKAIIVNFIAELVNIPFVPDFMEMPAKKYAIGLVVDLVVEKLNMLFDWDFGGVAVTGEQVAKLADFVDMPTVKFMDVMAAVPKATIDEKFSALTKELAAPAEEDKWTPSIKFAMQWEGGKNFRKIGTDKYEMINKADKGGPTNMGITIPTLKAAYAQGIVKHEDINMLTTEEAQAIYKKNYWERYGWDKLAMPVCLCALDCSINHGGFAWILQRALAQLGVSVDVDGKYGPATKAALISTSGTDAKALAKAIVDQRKVYYDKIIEKDSSQEANKSGWYNRVNAMARAAGLE